MSSQLEHAILSLFSGASVAESNEFIIAFVETDAAWGAALALFAHQNDVVAYFAANIIYTKIKKHWSQLPGEQRDSLFRMLMSVIDEAGLASSSPSSSRRQFLNRVMLSLSCVSAYAPGGLQLYIHAALHKLDPTSGETMSASSVLLALEMLTVLPPEVEALDISHAFRLDLQAHLLEASSAVMAAMDGVASSIITAPSDNDNNGIKVAAIKALRSWLLVGMTISKLTEDHGPSLRLVYDSMQSGQQERIQESCALIRALICTTEYPPSKNHNAAILHMVGHIIASMQYIFPLLGEEGYDDVAHEVCTTVTYLTTQEVKLLASPQACNTELFDLLLLFAASKPRKISSSTFDVWLALQELPVVERHPYVTQEVFFKLLGALLTQCTYPQSWASPSDEEDLVAYRDSSGSVQDVLLGCFFALQDTFFMVLGAGLAAAGTGETSWQALEGVLFVLHAVMDATKNSIMLSEGGGACALQFLFNALQMVLGIPPHCIQKCELASTACKFLGSLTFLLAGGEEVVSAGVAPFRELFAPALEFVFLSVENPLASKAAAKAIYQLCIHGRGVLTTPDASSTYLLGKVVAATARLLSPAHVEGADEDAVAQVIEGVVRCVLLLPLVERQKEINELGQVVVGVLGPELAAGPAGNVQRVAKMLKFAKHIVMFCEAPCAASLGEQHVLYDFFSVLWPQLHAVEALVVGGGAGGAGAGLSTPLLDLYSTTIVAAGALVRPEVPRITQTIVSTFQQRGEGSTASLRCAKCIVDILADDAEALVFLVHLLECLTTVLYTRVQEAYNGDSGYEPECIETFFDLVITCLCSAPSVLASSATVTPQILQLCLATLRVSKERKSVQAVLQVLQTFFHSAHPKLRDFQAAFFGAVQGVGAPLVAMLVEFMSGGLPSTLWNNVSEAIHHVITGCAAAGTSGECRAWFQAALAGPEVFSMLSPEDKQQAVTILFDLAGKDLGGASRNSCQPVPRRYKAFLLDLCKIGAGILPVDALGVYC